MARILLIDHLNQIFVFHHRQSPNITLDYLSALRRVADESKTDRIILCCDYGRSKYRTGIHPGYKGDRYAEREKKTPQEKRQFEAFLAEASKFQDVAGWFGIEAVSVYGTECDDILAYIVANTDLTRHQLCILSSDQDLYGLLRPNVVQGSLVYSKTSDGPSRQKNGWINQRSFQDYFGIEPWQWYHVKALKGDAGDSNLKLARESGGTITPCIKSPDGLGEVAALKMIQAYRDIDGVEANLDRIQIKGLRKTVIPELKENFSQIRQNFRMMNLLHGPEVMNEIFTSEAQKKLNGVISRFDEKPTLNKDAIEEWSFETGQLSIAMDLDGWVGPFVGD